MARGRMINITIAEDEAFNAMSIDAQFIFMRTLPHLDRDGLITGNVTLLSSKVAPLLPEYNAKMAVIIQEWIVNGFVMRYQDGKRDVLFFLNFRKNQFGMRYEKEGVSQFASPPGYERTSTGLVPSDSASNSGSNTEDGCTQDNVSTDKVRPDSVLTAARIEEEKKGNNNTCETDTDASATRPPLSSSENPQANVAIQGELSVAIAELEAKQTLALMASWDKNKPQPIRTRLSPTQAAIVESQPPMTDPPSRVQAASMLPPTVNPNRVIPVDGKDPLIVPLSTWTQLMTALLECVGAKPRVESGDHAYRKDAEFKLELIYKMSTDFRTTEGVRSILKSWQDNDWRGNSSPNLGQFLDHASKMRSGTVVCERKDKPKPTTPATNLEPRVVDYSKYDPMAPQKKFFTHQPVNPQ